MKFNVLGRLLTVVTLTTGGAALAQNNPIAGTWQCSMAYTEFNANGSRNSGFTEQSILYLYPNGSFAVSGQQVGIGGTWDYQGQGNWQFGQTEQGLGMSAQGVRTDPTFGQAQYVLVAYLSPDGRYIYNQINTPQPNGQGLQARTNVQCQRG